MRALAVGRVEDSITYKQMEKILNVSLGKNIFNIIIINNFQDFRIK